MPARPATGGDKGPFAYDADLAARIEARWQEHWEADGTFDSPNPSGPLAEGFQRLAGSPKFYILDMFPYPSGAGLHVGHPLGYIGTDVLARYLRMTGHHVLHTFGYDAFGLPAEQYAIDTGQHPEVTTAANIATMRRQLRRLGLGHDRRRELATTEVSFYRWTQWIFLQLFNSWYDERAGRARPIAELVSALEAGARLPGAPATPWARLDQLARRRLVDDHRLAYLSEVVVNWCPGLGTVLANEEVTADGRSDVGNYPVYRRPLRQWVLRITVYAERLLADLDLVDWPESIKRQQRDWIGRSDGARIELPLAEAPATRVAVFTTRPDTLPGATFLVLAPEHPQVDQLVAPRWPASTPAAWRGPGGGDGWTPQDAVDAYRHQAARRSDRQRLVGSAGAGGVFTGTFASNPATGEPMPVFVADYVLTGYGTGAVMGVPAHDQRDLEFARALGLPLRAVVPPPSEWLERRGRPAGEQAIRWLEERGLGARARSYRMRDWLFSRQRYWGEPFPIVYDEHGLPVALPEELLPVELPEMTDFRPQVADETSVPVPPLARAGSWVEVELDLGGGRRRYRRETNTMPQWAGSCWYYLRFLDPGNDTAMVDPEIERYWMRSPGSAEGQGGVDLYVGGVEHAVLHLLYARFWHKVLFDLGHVSTREPFLRLYNQGYILADAFLDSRGMYRPAAEVTRLPDGGYVHGDDPVSRRSGKMGKSLKNGISPDEIYAAYGADTLRLYEMAMGPLDADRPWRTDDIVGVHRFLQRLWRNVIDEWTGKPLVEDGPVDQATMRRLHRTVAVVRKDFAAVRLNTAIARLIELNHDLTRLAARGKAPRAVVEPLVLMVAPLAPHIAEELWARLGHQASLAYERFPEPDPALAKDDTVRLPVQVNGKVRFQVEVGAEAGEDEVRAAVLAHGELARFVAGGTVRRIIVVPGRIVNLVVG